MMDLSHYNNIVLMMGPLCIGMAFLSTTGDWLEGCGWAEFLEKARINIPRWDESFLDGRKVKISRHAYQISLEASLNLLNEPFKSQSEIAIYEEWEDHFNKSVNAKHCFTVTELESLVFGIIIWRNIERR